VHWLAPPNHVELVNYFLLPTRLDALGAGVLIAVLYSRKDQLWHTAQRLSVPVCLLSLFVLLLMLAGKSDPKSQLFGYTVCAVLYASLLVITLSPNAWTKMMQYRFMQWAGRVSYSTYLVHPILLVLVFGGRTPVIENFSDVTRVCVAAALSLLSASLMYALIEKPVQQVGHELFRYTKSSVAACLPLTSDTFASEKP
jgi:peptidoglycan/LPS O-acetylase OafA/YrhL